MVLFFFLRIRIKDPPWRLVGKARRAAIFSGTNFFSFTLVRYDDQSRGDFKADTQSSPNLAHPIEIRCE
jgi:hypothetical protein